MISAIITACRKPKDNTSPRIEILSPQLQSSYSYSEILPVRITFSDEQPLDQVQIELVRTDDQIVFFAKTLYPNVATYVFDENILLQDRYWPEGEMFLRVTASDGTNTSAQIRSIDYGEAPLTLDNEWRILRDGQGYSVFSLQNQLIHSESKGYVCGGYEPRTGKYWFAHNDGTLVSRSVTNEYEVSTFNLGAIPLTSNYALHLEQFFLGCENGSIWKWQNGNVQSFVASDNRKVRQIASTNDHLFVWKEDPVTGQDHIFVYYIQSGAQMNSVISTFDIASIVNSSNQKILVAGNSNGNSQFGWLQPQSEAILSNFTFTETSPVQNLWPAINGGFFAMHNTGLIYYSADLTSMQSAEGILPLQILIDPVHLQYRVITSNGVYRMDIDLNSSVFIPQKNIIDYILLYNK